MPNNVSQLNFGDGNGNRDIKDKAVRDGLTADVDYTGFDGPSGTATTPQDGDAWIYNATTHKWEPSDKVSKLIDDKEDKITWDYSKYLETESIQPNGELTVSFASLVPTGKTLIGAIVTGWTPVSTWDTVLYIRYINTNSKTVTIRAMGTTTQKYSISFGLWYR